MNLSSLDLNVGDIFKPIIKIIGEKVAGTIGTLIHDGKEQLAVNKKLEALTLAQGAITNEYLMHYIKHKYSSEPILERCGFTYPVAVYPATKEQRSNVESILKKPLVRDAPTEEDFKVNDKGAYRAVISGLLTKPADVNDMTYSMKSLSIEHGLQKLYCELGTYFNSYDTSEALEWEIRSKVNKLTGNSIEDFTKFEKKLPLRSALHKSVANPVLDATGRNPAIGVSTLVAYKESGGTHDKYQFLVRRRGFMGVPIRAGLLHVVPSFMFQPTATQGIEAEYNIEHNILREFLEEIYDYTEITGHENFTEFYKEKPVKELKKLLANGKAKLYFTGMAINLLNLRPEICTLLVISDAGWYKRSQTDKNLKWRFNSEFTKIDDHSWIPPKQLIGKIEFSANKDGDSEMLNSGFVHPALAVPAGAAAFWLGVDALRAIENKS